MKRWLIILPFIILGCNQPSNDRIQSDFQRVYPTAKIIVINPLEKSTDSYRVRISFREQGNDAIYEDVSLYVKIDGQWVNTGRQSSPKKVE